MYYDKTGVKHEGKEWLQMISELMEICAIRPFVDYHWRAFVRSPIDNATKYVGMKFN